MRKNNKKLEACERGGRRKDDENKKEEERKNVCVLSWRVGKW